MQVIEPPRLVLDTNVALDWLVFADPAVQDLADAVKRRQVVWIACPAMRTELAHMLNHAGLARWNPDPEQALACFDRFSHRVDDPEASDRAPARCRDPDDQLFLDIAWRCQVRWLVTRDKDLLALARKVRAGGLSIVTPAGLASARGDFPPGPGMDSPRILHLGQVVQRPTQGTLRSLTVAEL